MKPYYQHGGITIYHGDCREILPSLVGIADLLIVDPPYGDTSLSWDERSWEWLTLSLSVLKASGSLWCFGSFRMFLESAGNFREWKLAQDLIWEKHNGSSFHADRFKRVHEHIVQFYRGEWSGIFKAPVFTQDATARTVRRKERPPPHTGKIGASTYVSVDGGPRLMRSVITVRSCHGSAYHPTQKPTGIITPLIEYSCPTIGCVVDPFAGSGSTLLAAKQSNRKSVGIELEERYCEIAAKRLRQEVFAFETGGPERTRISDQTMRTDRTLPEENDGGF